MKYTYVVRVDIVHDEDNVAHTVYGIDLFEDKEIIQSLPDIFFDRQKAKELVALCNTLGLSPVHLLDVAEDAIL